MATHKLCILHYPIIKYLFLLYKYREDKEKKEEEVTSVFADIKVNDIPDVPSQKFLMRGDPQQEESKER